MSPPIVSTATPYYALADFVNRTVMPASDVAIVETATPGKTAYLIAGWQAWIDSRLRKRYAVPFNQNGAQCPEIVLGWLTKLVTPDVYRARGVNPGQDDQVARLDDMAAEAKAEIKEAADSKEGLFDLPTLDGVNGSAVSQGSPLASTQTSPYAWQQYQRADGLYDDLAADCYVSGGNPSDT